MCRYYPQRSSSYSRSDQHWHPNASFIVIHGCDLLLCWNTCALPRTGRSPQNTSVHVLGFPVALQVPAAMAVTQTACQKHEVLCGIFRDHDPGYLRDIVDAVCALTLPSPMRHHRPLAAARLSQ